MNSANMIMDIDNERYFQGLDRRKTQIGATKTNTAPLNPEPGPNVIQNAEMIQEDAESAKASELQSL